MISWYSVHIVKGMFQIYWEDGTIFIYAHKDYLSVLSVVAGTIDVSYPGAGLAA